MRYNSSVSNTRGLLLTLFGILAVTATSGLGAETEDIQMETLADVVSRTGDNQAETIAGVGLGGLFDSKQTAQMQLEHHFAMEVLPGIRPYLAGGVASDDSANVGLGLAYRRVFQSDFRLMLGSGPAYYESNGGKDLGSNFEFISFIQVDRSLGKGRYLGLRLSHISNAGIGNDNPGREFLGIMFSRPFGRWRGQ